MKRIGALVLVACVLAVAGCRKGRLEGPAGTSSEQSAGASVAAAPAPSRSAESLRMTPPGAESAASGGDATAGGLDSLWAEQKLIRDGRLEIEVDDVEAAVARVGTLAASRHGQVAGSEIQKRSDGRRSGTVTLRVPADAFAAVFADLRPLGRVRSESTTTEDVTKQYTDLGLRLAVKRRARERLEALLATRGSDLSSLLQVERELERVVGEIERMEGEKRYYDQRIAVSTVTLVLFEPGAAESGPGFLAPIREALHEALSVLATSIAALIYVGTAVLPWLLLAGLLWQLLRRWRRRRAASR